MARGRKPAQVNIVLLQSCITEVESKGLPSTRSELHDKVVELYNSKCTVKINASVVLTRIANNLVKCNTPVGQRGRKAGQTLRVGSKPAGRKPKTEADLKPYRDFVEAWTKMYGEVPSCKGRLARAAKGSMKALIELKCIACSGFSQAEVKACASFSCSLHPVRPYQHVTVNGNDIEEEINDIEIPDNDTDFDDGDLSELVA